MPGAFEDPKLNMQVPPGNPIAEHYQDRAGVAGSGIPLTGTAAGGLSLGALLALISGEPIDAAIMGSGAAGFLGMTGKAQERERELNATSNMWHNRFGSGDPNQGLPGLPSGPAWRK